LPGNLKWTDALRGFNNSTPGQDGRRNVVRYDSPAWQGFTATWAWGEDDLWDVALSYKGDIHDFNIVAKGGYGSSNDPGTEFAGSPTDYVVGGTACISGSSTASSLPKFRCEWMGGAATVTHKPTGLFVYGGWGKQIVDTNGTAEATLFQSDSSTWFIQPGIEQKWWSLGPTTVFGMYREDDAGSNPGKTVDSHIHFWQAGVVQGIDAAATKLYVLWQQADGDVFGNAITEKGGKGAVNGRTKLDAFNEVIMGAKIDF